MKLNAWQEADDLAPAVFRVAEEFPQRQYWLASQITRAAVSVPANIAEGYGRGSQGDYLRFLDIARGSLSEVEYYIPFLERESLVPDVELKRLKGLRYETGRLLFRLWQAIKAKSPQTWDHSGSIREVGEERYEANA